MIRINNFAVGVVVVVMLSSCSDSSEVVATVNDRDISRATIEAYLKYKNIPIENSELVNKEVQSYLRKTGLADAVLQQDALDQASIEVEIEEFRKQMLLSRYFEKFLAENVNEQAVKNFYASNQDRYQSKKAHVAHILLRTNQKMSEQERQALLTRAHEIYGKADAGESFEDLVLEYSEDKLSAKNGGDLGWVQEGAIDPAFTKVAFELKKGEISKPIVTPFGFHVIKVLEEAQVMTQPFEAVKGNIRYELRQKAKKAEMERLKGLVEIEMNEFVDEES